MTYDDDFFEEMYPQIAQVIGAAVMHLLVEGKEVSNEGIATVIKASWHKDMPDLATEMALDVLQLRR